jgi:hypothetical protein
MSNVPGTGNGHLGRCGTDDAAARWGGAHACGGVELLDRANFHEYNFYNCKPGG